MSYNQADIPVTGGASVALGINTKVVASGYCDNPITLPYSPLSDFLNNPIKSCVFCKGGKCYYGGECERRKPFGEVDNG